MLHLVSKHGKQPNYSEQSPDDIFRHCTAGFASVTYVCVFMVVCVMYMHVCVILCGCVCDICAYVILYVTYMCVSDFVSDVCACVWFCVVVTYVHNFQRHPKLSSFCEAWMIVSDRNAQ